MSALALIQILFNVVFILAVLVVWRKASRTSQDDPRLSRGLQLLQSKIAILEDLSDRTDQQVKTLTSLLERRSQSLQEQMFEAEKHVSTIRKSMDQSLEVAKIFQDKIPHEEIIERKNTIKYVQAARLAHQGASVESIRNQVDLPDAELDFLVKMNRQGLMFNEEQLPSWVQTQGPIAPNAFTSESTFSESVAAHETAQPARPARSSVPSEHAQSGQSLTFRGASTLEIPFSHSQTSHPLQQQTSPDSSLMDRLTESQLFKKASEVLDHPTTEGIPVGDGASAQPQQEAEDPVKRFEFPRLDPFGNLS